jgi:hypothetical protein
MKNSIQVHEHARANLPLPLVNSRTIERMLLRHAKGPVPQVRLVVAVICQAMIDCRSGAKDDRRTASSFLCGDGLDTWASLVDLNPDFIRIVAIKTHYLAKTSEKLTDQPINHCDREDNHA